MHTIRSIHAKLGVIRNHVLANHGAYVVEFDGDDKADFKPVKNLGWLLRHHTEVIHPMVGTGFYVMGWSYGKSVTIPPSTLSIDHFDPILVAALDDGRFYTTPFASVNVLHRWLKRPIFMHYIVNWNYSHSYGFPGPQTCAIGGHDYKLLPLRRDHPSYWDSPERLVAA